MSSGNLRLGVDLGGTKIEAVLLAVNGEVLQRQRAATPVHDYATLLSAIGDLCDRVEADEAVGGAPLPLGICTPGSPSPADGRMRNCNSTVLNGRPLREDLRRHLGRPVRLANDADCFALSEARDGAAAGARSVLGLILGTGVGGGLVIGGELLHGPNAVAGEWGHNRMPLERVVLPPALTQTPRPCYCGRSDCVETWLSGPGLALTHRELHGRDIDAHRLHAGVTDEALEQTLDLYLRLLAAALASVVNIMDPEVIVLGGGLSNIPLLQSGLAPALGAQLFSDCMRTRLCAAAYGDSSGVRGAAGLWHQR